ncbi:uncharacterized protein LOC114828352 [Galendromus occidentalis]|uniref:Uncharacterized protein LOC114828352 n=1 Tax=Galendromus occidentalis TaxID=34638 RepID=A0AAJ7WI54_9ACAR|nr:uncharacterized protein LOC114828352 [Galendromus occidentalis]
MDNKRRDSDESLTSATESELVAQVNRLSTAILGTNENVTMLNERLTEYQKVSEEALRELQRNMTSPRILESTPRVSKGSHRVNSPLDNSPLQSLVSVLREKDLTMSVVQKDNMTLREQLERLRYDLEKSRAETQTEKENLKRWRRMIISQVVMNIASVNRLIETNRTIPPSLKERLLSERHPQADIVLQLAELSSKLQWLCQFSNSSDMCSQRP